MESRSALNKSNNRQTSRRTEGQMDGDFTNCARAYERKRGGGGKEGGEPDYTEETPFLST